MIKTRSNEMKIEREKSYVWCLVGMSMRSAIWNRFWDPKWSQNGSQSAPKSVPKRVWKEIAIRSSKEKARRPLAGHKLEGFGPSGGGETEEGAE